MKFSLEWESVDRVDGILNWISQTLDAVGVPLSVVAALFYPLLTAAVIAVLRAITLRLIRTHLRRQKDLRRWRRITLYIALLIAGIAFEYLDGKCRLGSESSRCRRGHGV